MIFKSFYKHFSALVFDTSFLHYFSTIIFYSIRHQLLCRIISKKAVDSTAFFVILRQISTAFDIQCKKCCRKRLSNFNSTIFFDIKPCGAKNVVEIYCRKKTVVENCCRKFLAKNVGEIYCRKKLS